jgi:hypothetical protein
VLEKLDIHINEDVVLQKSTLENEEKSYAFNVVSGNGFELNEVSYFILNLIQNKTDLEEILRNITTEYKISREEALKDFNEFIDQCICDGILLKSSHGKNEI